MKRWQTLFILEITLLSLRGLPSFSASIDAKEVEEDNSLASTLVTPHEPWGKGWAGGPARTLFFVYTGPYDGTWEDTGTRVREVVELQQRFDLPGDAVLFCGKGDNWVFHGLRDGEDRAERLLKKPYDLYVIAGFPLDKLHPKFQYLILEQVAKGAGLVCCGSSAKDFMVARRKIDPTPSALINSLPVLDAKTAAQYVTAYRLGKGRGVWLNYGAQSVGPRREFSYRGLTEYDYWMALVGRAALWAAGNESPVGIDAINGDKPAALDRASHGNNVEVVLSNGGEQSTSVIVVTALRRASDGMKQTLGATKLVLEAGKPASLKVNIPAARAGDYFLDVVARDSRGVVAFGAGNVTVSSEPGIEKVEVDRTFVERGQAINATATLRGDVPAGAVLRMRLRDSYDRIVWQRDISPEKGQPTHTVEYRADGFATILMRVEAALVVGGQEADMKDADFSVPKRRQGQMNFVMWDAPLDVLGYYTWRQLQEAGMGVCLLGSFSKRPQPEALRACDASLAPYSTRILDPKDDNGYMQPVCWNDDPAASEYVRKIVDNQSDLREQGVFVYSLGDEGVTKGCCVHPKCLAAYRQWLQGQYGTIQKLNNSWSTTYKTFDDVNLLNPEDNMEIQARKTCFPRWYDREAFARYNLMQFSKRFVDAYRRLDPESLCGFEGTGGFGDDYDAILTGNTFYGPYPSIGDDIVRWNYPRERVRSNWMGYSKTGDALSDAAWRMMMKGMDSIWYWMWSGIGSWRGYLRPTLDFWPAIDDLMKEMQPVREGLGDLILQSEMRHSGIAIFYSLPSALSGQLENSGAFVSPETAHINFLNVTSELGMDAKYLTSAMLNRGALQNEESQVLLLPMTQALSIPECDIIRRFVENGGTVIADVRPGVYDDHCKPLQTGSLDALFGIKRTGRGTPVEAAVSVKGELGGRTLRLQFPQAKVDSDVQLDSAQALGVADKTPVLLVNRVGKGRAILLNFHPQFGRSTDLATTAMRDLLKTLYNVAGARGAITATDPAGGAMPVTETRVWQNGDSLVFGLWRRMENAWFGPKSGTVAGEPQPARVSLDKPSYIYDLRAHKCLGSVTQINTRLKWGRPNFYLSLPYEIKGLRVTLPAGTPKVGQPFVASISLNIPPTAKEKFACWVQVVDPEGKSPLWGRQVVLLAKGKAQLPLMTAFNDRPGKWRVRVKELFSNTTVEASWTVQ